MKTITIKFHEYSKEYDIDMKYQQIDIIKL